VTTAKLREVTSFRIAEITPVGKKCATYATLLGVTSATLPEMTSATLPEVTQKWLREVSPKWHISSPR